MKFPKQIITLTTLLILLVVPPLVYFYVTKGHNNFIKLAVIGEEGHRIPDFSFINQDRKIIINNNFKNNIYVANFFFTSCPTICPVMTKNMAYLQIELSMYPSIKFLSHTVDPSNDTPEQFLKYINKLRSKNVNVNLDNWDFVTGSKKELYDIAKSYFVNVSMDSLAPGGFLHSEYFILIDKEGRIRSGIDKNKNVVGVYDGTSEVQMKDLINDIKVLMAEYKKPTTSNEE